MDVRQLDDLTAATPELALPARSASGAGLLLALEVGGGDALLVRPPDGRELLVDDVGPTRAVGGQCTPVEFGAGKDDEVVGSVAEP
ncbi:hypothetical protein OG226_21510 [Streptomyces sp. NBC_01261]|uniref:hypothetical protein n=1 Tax=Streptomyces sp. NBC_01261 TaxID=2903802 RepID=UPI002E2F7E7A|nr:hypothetical protein [Streptomyces sp. NBC_01261]